MWEVKKISRFLSTGHQIPPSCGCKVRKTVVAKSGLLILRDGAISHNRPQIASDRTIHEKSHNSQKIEHYSQNQP